MRSALARLRAVGRWLRLLKRLKDLEASMGALKSCPGCGAAMVLGHPKVAIVEVAPGQRRAVCRWCHGDLMNRLKGTQKKRA